jgi:hypothetical protein
MRGEPMTGSTINTKITHGVTLGSPGYLSPLTITSAGDIAPSAAGATALFATLVSGYVLNQGMIASGTGGTGSDGGVGAAGGTGGIGVDLTAGTLTNDGAIASGAGGTGGTGGLFDPGGMGGAGGIGVDLAGGNLTNASGATIDGGTGGLAAPAAKRSPARAPRVAWAAPAASVSMSWPVA